MLSRVADSLYWMARYLERAENTTLLLDANIQLMLEQKPQAVERQLRRINLSLGQPLKIEGKISVPALEHALIFDPQVKTSIISCVMQARENARQVREQISSEMWSEINGLYHFVKKYDAEDLEQELPLEFLNEVRRNLSLFKGETDATMSHGEEWWFLQFGRHMERAVNTCTMLNVHSPELCGQADIGHLELLALLRSCSAFEAYLKKYTAEFSAENIVEFLLLNPQHPHSILFCVRGIQQSIAAFPVQDQRSTVERLAGRLVATLSYSSVDEILASGLNLALDNVIRQCVQVHSALHQTYIDYPIETSLPA
ncbi:alpha-E domain-containing protein [Bryobacter aggregatus]|uniref:alpha-E domain-containing protein n=1 Tax=Bryobacter aggregatus TaxID=360054 RepID=UPI0004E230B6|nr:alpha-E domain-containing protein [Bryobacter aggregatus]